MCSQRYSNTYITLNLPQMRKYVHISILSRPELITSANKLEGSGGGRRTTGAGRSPRGETSTLHVTIKQSQEKEAKTRVATFLSICHHMMMSFNDVIVLT